MPTPRKINSLEAKTSLIHVRSIGKRVADRLSLPSYTGKVLSVVTSTIYLLGQDDEVFWLTDTKHMHERAVQVDALPDNISTQSGFNFNGNRLQFESGSIDLSHQKTWISHRLHQSKPLSAEEIEDRCSQLYLKVKLSPSPKGFGVFLPRIEELMKKRKLSDSSISPGDLILETAWEPVREISLACATGDTSHLLHHCSRLVGLGLGLTPSGDDFVGGLLYCLISLRALMPSRSHISKEDIDTFIQSRQFKTNIISYCLLKDMCNGSASEAETSFVTGLFLDPSPNGLDTSFTNLIQIGHSTGWDSLTGIMAASLVFTAAKKNNLYST